MKLPVWIPFLSMVLVIAVTLVTLQRSFPVSHPDGARILMRSSEHPAPTVRSSLTQEVRVLDPMGGKAVQEVKVKR